MVPKGGLEPPRVSPPPPQDGVSTKFHHFGMELLFRRLLSRSRSGLGRLGGSSRRRRLLCPGRRRRRRRLHPFHDGVAPCTLKKVLPPVEPKSVWEEPPKRAPMSAPLPFCRRTMTMRATHTTMCNMTRTVCIVSSIPLVRFTSLSSGQPKTISQLLLKFNNTNKGGTLETCPSHQDAVNVRHCHQRIHIVRLDAATI
jgi:hypothetical protein